MTTVFLVDVATYSNNEESDGTKEKSVSVEAVEASVRKSVGIADADGCRVVVYENGHLQRSAHMFGCSCVLCEAATRVLASQVEAYSIADGFMLVFALGNLFPFDSSSTNTNTLFMTALPISYPIGCFTLDAKKEKDVPQFLRRTFSSIRSTDLAEKVSLGAPSLGASVCLEVRERFGTKLLLVRESTRPTLVQVRTCVVFFFALTQRSSHRVRKNLYRGLATSDLLEPGWKTVRQNRIETILRELLATDLFDFREGDVTYANNDFGVRLCFVRNEAGDLASRLCLLDAILEVSISTPGGKTVLVNGHDLDHRDALAAILPTLAENLGFIRSSRIPVSFVRVYGRCTVLSALFIRDLMDRHA